LDEDTKKVVDNSTITHVFRFKEKDQKTEKGEKTEKIRLGIEGKKETIAATEETPKYYDSWVLWTARVFWMSWFLFLFNLIPAFPLDGGRLMQSLVWGRSGDFRRGTMVAVYTGFVVAVLFILISFWQTDPLLLGMAVFIWIYCRQQYIALEMAENESVF